MKLFNLLTWALIPFAAAVPLINEKHISPERRAVFDLTQLNNLTSFNQLNLNYLLQLNSLDLQLLSVLGSVHNFNVLGFKDLFQAPSFDVQHLLQLQQLQTLLQFQRLGLFNRFDLAGLKLDLLQLGLINGVGFLDLAQFIPRAVEGQVKDVVERVVVIKVPKE
ncbi:hypothetical protein B0T20DRAFT_202457 [Sordaria brevicollis]|uniref:Uncharacterized protein n=1 Tax=Sordaria brevicollis TaxID=83679 RepID=A0AAE0PE39_SORBR|nr:hypothetical protein B0T20DRAFT_202457 [Sordaria brevicollis]